MMDLKWRHLLRYCSSYISLWRDQAMHSLFAPMSMSGIYVSYYNTGCPYSETGIEYGYPIGYITIII